MNQSNLKIGLTCCAGILVCGIILFTGPEPLEVNPQEKKPSVSIKDLERTSFSNTVIAYGELYRNKGQWNGQQIVSKNWVDMSVKPSADHLQAGRVIVGGHIFPFGYGYQWWVPEGDIGEFAAIGVYNQFIFVDPSRDAVIVKLSANRAYGTSPDEGINRERETVEFLRTLAKNLD